MAGGDGDYTAAGGPKTAGLTRKEKNRQSALRSRLRKQELVAGLEERIKGGGAKKAELLRQLAEMQARCDRLAKLWESALPGLGAEQEQPPPLPLLPAAAAALPFNPTGGGGGPSGTPAAGATVTGTEGVTAAAREGGRMPPSTALPDLMAAAAPLDIEMELEMDLGAGVLPAELESFLNGLV